MNLKISWYKNQNLEGKVTNLDTPTHQGIDGIYYGYWSFEAGAIAKKLHLDDTSLKNVPYYPYDLVHYKKVMP